MTAGLIWLFRPVACRIGLVDRPGGRKSHKQATPLIGGVAIFCAFLLLLLTLDIALGQWRSFFLAGAVVFIIGLLDDFQETPPWARFAAQVGASLIIVLWGNVELQNLGGLFSNQDVLLGVLVVPFSIFCSVGVINATNMLDGLDGLAGGLLLILFGTLLALAWQGGLMEDARILLLLCGVLAGFLLFNFRFADSRAATVFLGDAGSLFLGLAAAWFLIRFTQEPIGLLRPITAIWLFALPIMDTVAIMSRRVMLGRSPFSADREHFHHILRVAGFSARTTVFIMLGVSLLMAVIGLAGEWAGVPEFIMFYGFLALFAVYFWGMHHAWKVMKALRRVHDQKLRTLEKRGGNANV
ncbi:undecaprenyl-phosphate alpha-N-acetylglucosaminyl 1-phosphate transferase [Thiolapillus sp.]